MEKQEQVQDEEVVLLQMEEVLLLQMEEVVLLQMEEVLLLQMEEQGHLGEGRSPPGPQGCQGGLAVA